MRAGGRLATAFAVIVGTFAIPVANVSAAPSGGCPYPPHRPALAAFAAPADLTAGEVVEVFGTLRQNNCGVRNAKIVLQRRALVSGVPSGSWQTFGSVLTDSSGLYFALRGSTAREQFRALFAASGRYAAATSPTRSVSVAQGVSIKVVQLAGCRLQVSGSTYPAKAGRTVTIGTRGPAGHFSGWTSLWRPKTGPRGHYFALHAVRCGTTYNLSSYVAGDAIDLAGRSATTFGARSHL